MVSFIVENEELIVNPDCRQVAFMGYLRKKCQYDRNGTYVYSETLVNQITHIQQFLK